MRGSQETLSQELEKLEEISNKIDANTGAVELSRSDMREWQERIQAQLLKPPADANSASTRIDKNLLASSLLTRPSALQAAIYASLIKGAELNKAYGQTVTDILLPALKDDSKNMAQFVRGMSLGTWALLTDIGLISNIGKKVSVVAGGLDEVTPQLVSFLRGSQSSEDQWFNVEMLISESME